MAKGIIGRGFRGPGGQQINKMRQAPAPIRLDGRVVRLEGDLLIVEFESPDDGILLPPDGEEIFVYTADANAVYGVVDDTVSTRPGPHARGLTLRLGLRSADGATWPDDVEHMVWRSPDGTACTLWIHPKA